MLWLCWLLALALALAGARSRGAPALVFAAGSLAALVGLVGGLRLLQLPVPAARSSGFALSDELSLLLVSGDDLVAVGDEVALRARLPALVERLVLPTGQPLGELRSVAARGGTVAFTFESPRGLGWALLGPTGWIESPALLQHSGLAGASVAVDEQGSLLLALSTRIKEELHVQLHKIEPDGALTERARWALADARELPQEICQVGGQWHVVTAQRTCALPETEQPFRACARELPPETRCPGSLSPAALAELAVPAPRARPSPPEGWAPLSSWVEVTPLGLQGRSLVQRGPELLQAAGDGRWVQYEPLSAERSAELGLMSLPHAQVRLVDAQLRPLSPPAWTLGQEPRVLLLDTRREIVLSAQDGSAVARFDRLTLERLDGPSRWASAWERLERTGGAWPPALGLSLAVLGWPIAALALLRGQGTRWGLAAAVGLWQVAAVVGAAALWQRL